MTAIYGVFQGEEVSGISGTSVEDVQAVVQEFEQEIIAQREDQANNYGLLFYRCRYNGSSQQEEREYYRETYGVEVF